MRATRHNGRSGKHGVYNPKHNDRKFDIANSEHIDAEREKQNIYWDCYRGYVQNPSDKTFKNWEAVSRMQVFMILRRCIMKTITAIL